MGSPAARSSQDAYGRGLGVAGVPMPSRSRYRLLLRDCPNASRTGTTATGASRHISASQDVWSVTKPLIGRGLAAAWTPAAPGRRLGRTPYRSNSCIAAYRARHGSGSAQVTHRPLGVTARWRSNSTSAVLMLARATWERYRVEVTVRRSMDAVPGESERRQPVPAHSVPRPHSHSPTTGHRRQ